jgi:putative PIG3 family NAD(P)H quinone oxidoreductase
MEGTAMRAVLMNESGDPGVMHLGEADKPAAGEGEVLIEVAATAVNRADCAQRQGNYPPPPGASTILGLECAGRIAALGAGVEGWSVGDPVMTILSGGGYAEFATAPAGTLIRIPDGMSMVEAAAITEVFLTAYLNIFIEAGLKPDESVLIQGGASGVGTAGIQLAKRLGSKAVFVTVGSADKAEACKRLGADHAILYKEVNFAEAVNEITARKGVDVILDHIGGRNLGPNTDCLALRGRLVIIGLLGGAKAELNIGRLMVKRQRVIGSVLRSRSVAEKTGVTESFVERVMPHLADGTIKPVIHEVIDLDDAVRGHEMMEANANTGKIVMIVNKGMCDG